MTSARVSELRDLLTKIPAAPWDYSGGYPQRVTNGSGVEIAQLWENPDNAPVVAPFLVAAVNALPGLLHENDRLPAIRQDPARVYDIFTPAERAALVNECRATPFPVFNRARVLILDATGMRKSEALGLQPRHIDLRQRVIVVQGKGDKQRLIPIRGDVVNAIDEMLLEPIPTLDRPLLPTEFIWFGANVLGKTSDSRVLRCYPERQWSKRGFHEWWESIARSALGHAYRKPHMMRHTYATDILDATDNLYMAKELLGHASTRTTELYIHSSRTRLDKAVEALAEYRKTPEDES